MVQQTWNNVFLIFTPILVALKIMPVLQGADHINLGQTI